MFLGKFLGPEISLILRRELSGFFPKISGAFGARDAMHAVVRWMGSAVSSYRSTYAIKLQESLLGRSLLLRKNFTHAQIEEIDKKARLNYFADTCTVAVLEGSAYPRRSAAQDFGYVCVGDDRVSVEGLES